MKTNEVNQMSNKICPKCKFEFPATSEFFSKDNRSKSGFQSHCKVCQKKYAINNTEKKAEYLKQYAKNNSEKLSAYQKNYAKENAEKLAEYKKQYAKSNFENETKRKKKWVKDNFKRVSEYQKLYKKDHSEGCRINNQRREAIKQSLISDFTMEQWEYCLAHFDYKDAYTGLPMNIPSQDHIIPLSKGGEYTITNIIPCDRSINSSKGNRNMLTWFRKQEYYDKEREEKILSYISMVIKGFNPDKEDSE